jgi:hypothetical protein
MSSLSRGCVALAVLVALTLSAGPAQAAKPGEHLYRGKVVAVQRHGKGARLTIQTHPHHRKPGQALAKKNLAAQKKPRAITKHRTHTRTFTVTSRTRIGAARNGLNGLRALHRGATVTVRAHRSHADRVTVLHRAAANN